MIGTRTHYRIGVVQVGNVAVATASSSAFAATTSLIRVVADTDCYIEIGDGVLTASAADTLLPANTVEYFSVTPGQKIAFIRKTADGLINVSEMTV
jgi:hypothetical protein